MPQGDGPNDEESRQGDGVDLTVVKARGAERHGVIWMLAISLGAAVVLLGGLWLANFNHFHHVLLHQG